MAWIHDHSRLLVHGLPQGLDVLREPVEFARRRLRVDVLEPAPRLAERGDALDERDELRHLLPALLVEVELGELVLRLALQEDPVDLPA
ncbi:MAG: hypothetical protein IPJ77_21475, partial [Planctomycetes bacterium]|nr:hypothetical protein [Planctomycetota bacterium]